MPIHALAVAWLGILPSSAHTAENVVVAGSGGPRASNRTTIFLGLALPYEVIDGLAVHGGDMILGRAEDIESHSYFKPKAPAPDPAWPVRRDLAPTGTDHLWPAAVVPYTIDTDIQAQQRDDILEAIGQWNDKTVITLVERSDQPNYVRFYEASSGPCRAWVGMRGGGTARQTGEGQGVKVSRSKG